MDNESREGIRMMKIIITVFVCCCCFGTSFADPKCWESSPPTDLEKRLVYLDATPKNEPRCFDPQTLIFLRSTDGAEAVVRIYSKASPASRVDLAKMGINLAYDYQDVIYSCKKDGRCFMQANSWVFLDAKYEKTYSLGEVLVGGKSVFPRILAMTNQELEILFTLSDYDLKQKEVAAKPEPPRTYAPPAPPRKSGNEATE
jgi:hypothetical protein